MADTPSPLDRSKRQYLAEQTHERYAQFTRQVSGFFNRFLGPMIIGSLAAWYFMPQYKQFGLMALLVVVLFAASVAYIPLRRAGHELTGQWLLLIVLLIVIADTALFLPEVRPVVISGFITMILVGYVTIGQERGAHIYAVLCVFIFLIVTFLIEYYQLNYFTPLEPQISFWFALVMRVLFGAGSAVLVMIIVSRNDGIFQQFLGSTWDLERRTETERSQREAIETANREIAARVEAERAQRDALARVLAQIAQAAETLLASAAEIQAAAAQQASGATEQSAAVAQINTTVSEVRSIAEQTSRSASEAAGAAQKTAEISGAGQTAVLQSIQSIDQTRALVESIAENILALSEQTQQIGQINTSVGEIAAQSNMLALNASVEAARAGEQGKGFSVVAMEVRSLADQSRTATAQVKAILAEIQRATNATVMATEEGSKGVDHSVQLAAQARETIERLAQTVQEASQLAKFLAASGQQQVSGMDQIALAVQAIQQSSQQSLSSTRQTELEAQNLYALARQLSELAAQYK